MSLTSTVIFPIFGESSFDWSFRGFLLLFSNFNFFFELGHLSFPSLLDNGSWFMDFWLLKSEGDSPGGGGSLLISNPSFLTESFLDPDEGVLERDFDLRLLL